MCLSLGVRPIVALSRGAPLESSPTWILLRLSRPFPRLPAPAVLANEIKSDGFDLIREGTARKIETLRAIGSDGAALAGKNSRRVDGNFGRRVFDES